MISGPASLGAGPPSSSGGATQSEAQGFDQLLGTQGGNDAAAQAQEEVNAVIGEGLTQLGLSLMAQLGNELIREIKEAENEE